MYNTRNGGARGSSSRPRSTTSRDSFNKGNSRGASRGSENFNRREEPSSNSRNRDFLTSKTPRVFSSPNRLERSINRPETSYNRAEAPSNSRTSNYRSAYRSSNERGSYSSPSSNFNRGSSFGTKNNSRPSFGGGRSGGGRGGRFGSRGGRVAKQLDESLFVQEAQPIAEQVAYVPSFVYQDLPVSEVLLNNVTKKGYTNPTPIQDQSIPHILEGKDLVGIANTGTGKTAAFLIPLIEKVIKGRHNKILILVPTRELAEQIEDELFSLTKDLRIYAVKCIGGDNIQRQIYALKRGYNFIIGTPGRVEDLIDRRLIDLSSFNTIVLDEVDRMLDMGFVDEIKEIIADMPKEKQSLFFSATLDNKIEALIKTVVKPDYVKVSVRTSVTSKNISQNVVYYSDYEEKIEKLKKSLNDYADSKVLIFVNTKREVDKLDELLYRENYRVTSLHGDKRQNWRKKSIDSFKSGRTNILVATDVAARGLDITGVGLVLNYDIPMNHEDYIHRIGRTGRANQMGNALTFIQRKR